VALEKRCQEFIKVLFIKSRFSVPVIVILFSAQKISHPSALGLKVGQDLQVIKHNPLRNRSSGIFLR
jgi:hypothetical protein